MPNVWAHIIYGQKVLESIGEQTMIAASEDRKLFFLGCQGPDFLFYHRFLPWQKNKTMTLLGGEMHSKQCGPVLMDLLDAAAGRPAAAQAPDPAVLYTLGFVLHHLLDRKLHPYIFSKAGFRKWDHQRLEIMMDTIIARKLAGIETWKTEIWREIDAAGAVPDGIVDAFEQIVAVHYPAYAPYIEREHWRMAMKDMVRAQRLFFDPSGIRRFLTFRQIEPFVYRRDIPPLDIMNEQRKSWLDPANGKDRHQESVWDLWEAAMEEGQAVMRAVLEWLRALEQASFDPTGDEKLLATVQLRETAASLIDDRSYETGLPCSSGAGIRYAEPIWPDGGVAVNPPSGAALD
ncbi:hypothetical protein [Paenibacillus humicola]|uniref:hypothetical protein n=1 Tax=Paenibacillus humicola TaxID=3110540 RepID=UPI00237A81A3|nr:hypothetical protein [Paenibacillus humicola]